MIILFLPSCTNKGSEDFLIGAGFGFPLNIFIFEASDYGLFSSSLIEFNFLNIVINTLIVGIVGTFIFKKYINKIDQNKIFFSSFWKTIAILILLMIIPIPNLMNEFLGVINVIIALTFASFIYPLSYIPSIDVEEFLPDFSLKLGAFAGIFLISFLINKFKKKHSNKL